MWRMSSAQALIFVAVVAIAVALLALAWASPPGLRCRFAVTVIPRFIAAIRSVYATVRTCNGRTCPIADCVTQQRRCSGLRSVRTSIAHGRCIMRNHDLVSDGFLTLIAASLVLLGSSLLAFAIV